jgi:hypothetical protein
MSSLRPRVSGHRKFTPSATHTDTPSVPTCLPGPHSDSATVRAAVPISKRCKTHEQNKKKKKEDLLTSLRKNVAGDMTRRSPCSGPHTVRLFLLTALMTAACSDPRSSTHTVRYEHIKCGPREDEEPRPNNSSL